MIYLVWFILICVALWFVRRFLGKFKVPAIGCLVPVVGGVKVGKSTFSCAVTDSAFRRSKFRVKFKNFFRKLFKKPLLPNPVIYSNVPLNCDYVPVTRALLLRQEKPIPGSVCYLQEASLVADSQLIKDHEINNQLLLFFKLCGHQGLTVVLDTQSPSDLHYSVKRSMSQLFYVQKTVTWIPFILVCYVIESRYSEDGSVIFSQSEDTDNLVKKVLISKRIWKKFDCKAYSVLTDNKPVVSAPVIHGRDLPDLKARNIVSFRKEFNTGDTFDYVITDKKYLEVQNEKKNS